MTTSQPDIRPLRLWPGVALAVMQCLSWFLVPVLFPDQGVFGMLGAVFGALLIIVWWLLFSRASWFERLSAVAVSAVALFVTSRFVHQSIARDGVGLLLPILAVPGLGLAFVGWAVAS